MNDNSKITAKDIESLIDEDMIELLSASDTEITEMAKGIYQDVNAIPNSLKALVDSAVLEGGKRRVLLLKVEPTENTSPNEKNVLHWPVNQKENLITRIAQSTQLTLAARNRTDTSTEELDQDIEDLIELGVIDDNGNIL